MTRPPALLCLVTLGVSDLKRSRAFYEALGWQASGASNDSVVFFHGANGALALYPRELLAEDATVPDRPTGFSAVTLASNMRSDGDVDAFLAQARAAGGKILKDGRKVFWGGYSGYFADPDGHLWEVAHNPFFPIDDDGKLRLPP
jgi:catechol 2,3-dioxygenase-like lactoylglutathione lyase family enzyme